MPGIAEPILSEKPENLPGTDSCLHGILLRRVCWQRCSCHLVCCVVTLLTWRAVTAAFPRAVCHLPLVYLWFTGICMFENYWTKSCSSPNEILPSGGLRRTLACANVDSLWRKINLCSCLPLKIRDYTRKKKYFWHVLTPFGSSSSSNKACILTSCFICANNDYGTGGLKRFL